MATFTNQAILTYNNTVTASNVVTGEILEALSGTKTAVERTYRPGEDVTFVVSYNNSGATALTGLTVTDDLGAYPFGNGTVTPFSYNDGTVLYYVNGELQPTPTVSGTSPLVIEGIRVPANGNALIVYSARANEYAPLGDTAQITNTATATGAGLTAPVTAAETVAFNNEPVLTITKSLNPSTVSENGTLNYTFVIQNSGGTEADAAAGVTLTDTFDPALDNITVSSNGVALADAGDYTYSAASGAFATQPGTVTVPAATYTQDPTTGEWTTEPGVTVINVSGTV